MKTKPMTAWLIVWDWNGNHAKVDRPYVDIVSARRTPEYIYDYLQRLYGIRHYTFTERTDFERYNKRKNRPNLVTKEPTPQGPLITVGDNPFLKAKMVRNLVVEIDTETGQEILKYDPYRYPTIYGE